MCEKQLRPVGNPPEELKAAWEDFQRYGYHDGECDFGPPCKECGTPSGACSLHREAMLRRRDRMDAAVNAVTMPTVVCEIICQRPSVTVLGSLSEALEYAARQAMVHLVDSGAGEEDKAETKRGFLEALEEYDCILEGDYEVHVLIPTMARVELEYPNHNRAMLTIPEGATLFLPAPDGSPQLFYRWNETTFNDGSKGRGLSYFSPHSRMWRGSNERDPVRYAAEHLKPITPATRRRAKHELQHTAAGGRGTSA